MYKINAVIALTVPYFILKFKNLLHQVNNTVLTDMPDNGQRISASDISPTIPSQRSVSLSAGKGTGVCSMVMNGSYKQINEVVDLYASIILLDIVEVQYLY